MGRRRGLPAPPNEVCQVLRPIRSDVDVLLDHHLGTYMERYDKLARRIKRLEVAVGIEG